MWVEVYLVKLLQTDRFYFLYLKKVFKKCKMHNITWKIKYAVRSLFGIIISNCQMLVLLYKKNVFEKNVKCIT